MSARTHIPSAPNPFSTDQENAGQIHTKHNSNHVPQSDVQDWISMRSLSLSRTASIQTQESLKPGSPDVSKDDVKLEEASPALRLMDREDMALVSHTAVQKAKTSSEASSGTLLQDDRLESNASGAKRLFEHRHWRPTVALRTAMCPQFVTRRLDRIRRWWRGHILFKMWWWEAICCIIALGALLAIVATIHIHQSRPLPQWPYGLSVNAMIAIYTVILKAAAGLVLAEGISHLKWIAAAQSQSLSAFVAHDDASRGPLGALKLLWKNQYKSEKLIISPFISSLGAVITVLILLLDPFSQQIIRTYECQRKIAGEYGTIPRTSVYTDWNSSEASYLTPGPRRALNRGLFASKKLDVAFTCRTGNCTFANKYTTMAYCSSCMDATAQLQFEQYEAYDDHYNRTIPSTNVSLTGGDGDVTSDVTLSRGGVSGLVNFASSANGEIAIIRWDGEGLVPDENQTIRGYRCNLYPCLKTFRADITTSRMHETLVDETGYTLYPINGMAEDLASAVVDLDCLDNPDQRETLKQLGYQFTDTTRWLPYNLSLVDALHSRDVMSFGVNRNNPCEKAPGNQFLDLCNGTQLTNKALMIVPTRCIYGIDIVMSEALNMNLLNEMFTGTVQNSKPYGMDTGNNTDPMMALYYAGGSGDGYLEDLRGILRNVVDSLTTHIRQFGNFSEPATGEMYEYATCIRVRWAWLSYAAVIVGFLLIFFTLLVVYSRNNQSRLRRQWANSNSVPSTHDFKSSALTSLFHGLNGESLRYMKDIGATNQEKELEKRAKEITVKLVATDQGWKLSSVDL